jgi:hypothetical protein
MKTRLPTLSIDPPVSAWPLVQPLAILAPKAAMKPPTEGQHQARVVTDVRATLNREGQAPALPAREKRADG